MSPFQAVYGRLPPRIDSYIPGTTNVHVVDSALQERDQLLKHLRDNLVVAQNRMKVQSNRHRTEREFTVGDWVYLMLQPYRQSSVAHSPSQKLAPRFYGPYQVVKRIGTVAYKLALPPGSRVHDVFHVSQIKGRVGDSTPSSTTLPPIDAPTTLWKSAKILDRGLFKNNNKAITKLLIQWEGNSVDDATWELYDDFMARYPEFAP